jgi:hypothetical protein
MALEWVLEALPVEMKCLGHESDHSPPSSVEFESEWSCTTTPHMLGVYGDVCTCIIVLITYSTLTAVCLQNSTKYIFKCLCKSMDRIFASETWILRKR